jgi:predicted AlkP superfamily pyrophosphatase or phosphodiesterase
MYNSRAENNLNDSKGSNRLNKIVLVISDALRYDTAIAGMGFLGHLVETKIKPACIK